MIVQCRMIVQCSTECNGVLWEPKTVTSSLILFLQNVPLVNILQAAEESPTVIRIQWASSCSLKYTSEDKELKQGK